MSTPPLESIVFFTAYSITSDYNSDGLCITTYGSPVYMSPELSIAKPADANSTAFESRVTSMLQDQLGFTTCSGNDNPVQIGTIQLVNGTPTPLSTTTADLFLSATLVSSASNITSSSPTTSSAASNVSSGFTVKDKATTGVMIPVVAVIPVLVGVFLYLRRRPKQSESGEDTHGVGRRDSAVSPAEGGT